MTITIDKAGRIVVPKPLRERYGLEPGAEIEIEGAADGLRIRALSQTPDFIRKEGFLVHHGPSEALDLDIAAFIDRLREDRALTRQGFEK